MHDKRGERSGWIGAGVGYTSWAVVILLLTMLRGNWGALLEVGLPCLLLSLGLWQLTVLAVHGARSAFGPGAAAARAVLLGSLLLSIGILLLVANEFALPVLLQDPGIRQVLAATGSAMRLPPILPWLSLMLGAGLLLLPVWRLLGRASG